MLPRAQVQQMIWLGEAVTGQQLHASGLVSAVADKGRAIDVALRLAERLAAMAPNALASGKALLREAGGRTLVQQLNAERDHFVENLFHANGAEGLNAFVEKRAPKFC